MIRGTKQAERKKSQNPFLSTLYMQFHFLMDFSTTGQSCASRLVRVYLKESGVERKQCVREKTTLVATRGRKLQGPSERNEETLTWSSVVSHRLLRSAALGSCKISSPIVQRLINRFHLSNWIFDATLAMCQRNMSFFFTKRNFFVGF